jgi:hypothetical protein
VELLMSRVRFSHGVTVTGRHTHGRNFYSVLGFDDGCLHSGMNNAREDSHGALSSHDHGRIE